MKKRHPPAETPSPRTTRCSLAILSSLAFLPLILNNGVYWDDWEFYIFSSPAEKSNVIDVFLQSGHVWIGYFMYALSRINDSYIFYHFIIFTFYLLAAFFLDRILATVPEIGSGERFLTALVFALLPVNYGRIIFFNIIYAASYLLFFSGFFLLTRYMASRKRSYYILSLLSLFISFFTNSLLVFYYFTIGLYLLFTEAKKAPPAKAILATVTRYFDYLALPVLFWATKKLFIKPYGMSQGYNEFQFSIPTLWKAFTSTIQDTNTLKILRQCAELFTNQNVTANVLLLITVLVASYFLSKEISEPLLPLSRNQFDFRFMLFGFILIFAGLFPYYAVGKVPLFIDFESRHQLLMPLGMSLSLVYGVKWLFNLLRLPQMATRFTFALLILCFTLVNFTTYLELQVDWIKQSALIEHFKKSDIIRNNSTFVFADNTKDLNAQNRSTSFYEYNGMMRVAFNNEDRLGEDLRAFQTRSHFIAFHRIIDMKNPRMNMRGYVQAHPDILVNPVYRPDYAVIIDHGPLRLSKAAVPLILFDMVFNKDRYHTRLLQSIQLSYLKNERT